MCKDLCKADKLSEEKAKTLDITVDPEGVLLWTERHEMSVTPDIKCPICDKGGAVQSLYEGGTDFYFKGNCYLNRADAKRHMDLRLLESGNDPYKHMRQSGEVDDKIQKLKKAKIKMNKLSKYCVIAGAVLVSVLTGCGSDNSNSGQDPTFRAVDLPPSLNEEVLPLSVPALSMWILSSPGIRRVLQLFQYSH